MFVDVGITQVEMGSKNHEVVPTVLIAQISGLRNGGVSKLIGSLAKRNLVSKVQNSKCKHYNTHFTTNADLFPDR
jgi:RIO kinase 2